MEYGYVRVSTKEQNEQRQMIALREFGLKDEQIFIIAGEEDPVGQFGKGPTWLCAAYQKLGVRNVTVKLYPHMRHEITNETERGTVFVDIRDFVLGK